MKGRNQKGRLLVAGAVLLVLLIAGILVTGRIINRTAASMSDRIVTQMGEYHYQLLDVEFGKAEKVFSITGSFLHEHPRCTDTELGVLATTLLQTDPKISRIWFSEDDGRTIYDFRRDGGFCRSSAEEPGDFRRQIVVRLHTDTLWNRVVGGGDSLTWSLARSVRGCDGSRHLCGVDLSLMGLHGYMTNQNLFLVRSYAAVYNPEGVTIYHPDSLRIGSQVTDPDDLNMLRQVAATGQRAVTHSMSNYFGVEEERIYFPMQVYDQTWVAMVGIPHFTIEQQIEEFHFYTLLIAVISVVLFAALLVLAQRRWRREYDLRRESEKESAQLQLQRVLDQIDPHFLFNSLNSLYSLIRTAPEQAREFTLTLSRVYRHVLERRREILTSVADEIELTRQYYALQKIRLGDCIALTVHIDPAVRERLIPSMSLQTLVENAIKHNRITTTNPLHIRISTVDGQLVIENNLTPREDSSAESLGVGLESIRSVYRFYTSENIGIEIADGLFRCRLPLLTAGK